MPVNVPIAPIIFEATGFQVKAPDTEFGAVESQLQSIVAALEHHFISAPLGE